MSGTVIHFSFSHPLLSMRSVERSFARVVSYTFIIILLGLIVSLFVSDLPSLHWAGAFIALMFTSHLLYARRAPYSVHELFSGFVPSNNLALSADKESLAHCARVLETTRITGGSLVLGLMGQFLDKPLLSEALARLDISVKEFKHKLDEEYEAGARTRGAAREGGALSVEELEGDLARIFERAARITQSHSWFAIDDAVLFVAAVYENLPVLHKLLDFFSLDPADIERAVIFSRFAHRRILRLPVEVGGFAGSMRGLRSHRVNRSLTSRPTPQLDRFSVDVTDLARSGRAGFLIGHADEYERMILALSKPESSRNLVLVGDPGVGKEALVRHLAFNIISDSVPGALFDRRLVQLSLSDLMSGASQEELSARFTGVINEIVKAGNIILYIPEIHLMTKTTTSRTGGLNLSEMFAPILKSAVFPVIGTSFPREFKEYVEPQSEFFGTFETIRVQPISEEETTTLLTYDALLLERHYRVAVGLSAVKEAVSLASKYLRTKPLPSSAQDLLREVLAEATQRGLKRIEGAAVIDAVERKVSVPIHKATHAEAQTLLKLEEFIHRRYVDQEEAVAGVARALRAYRSGLAGAGGPIASFLFVGPTGVGKTELSKILADIQFGSEKFMVRFDMSEYQQKESISRFIGSPDGSVAGALTEAIIQRPYSLILLDEFEKAHPDLLNIFLQVLDEGRLTDSLGRVVDFQNTIIIATSNAESVYIQERVLAGARVELFADDLKKKLSQHFRPELLNRFSDVVVFKPLSRDAIQAIATLKLASLARQVLDAKAVELVFDASAIAQIATLGYDPSFGARPLNRAIDEHIKSVLSNKLLADEISKGEAWNISYQDNSFVFKKMSG